MSSPSPVSDFGPTHITHQSFLDEFDYKVSNLAADLRDGVRLAKLMDVLAAEAPCAGSASATAGAPPATASERLAAASAGPATLCAKLRVPAVSRLQKMHNVNLVLTAMRNAGVLPPDAASATPKKAKLHVQTKTTIAGRTPGATPAKTGSMAVFDVTAKDIVDGHRDKTLGLLWALIAHFDLKHALDAASLHEEVAAVRSAWSWRLQHLHSDVAVGRPVCESIKPHPANELAPLIQPSTAAAFPTPTPPNINPDLVQGLMAWCQSVCAGYGVPVTDFVRSFADGRALCVMVHYYHPALLKLGEIKPTSALLPREGGGFSEDSLWSMPIDTSKVTEDEYTTALKNERANFTLVRQRLSELGGVPLMVPASSNGDKWCTENPPEEKSMVTFLAHTAARLMESSKQIRAALRIQRAWLRVSRVLREIRHR